MLTWISPKESPDHVHSKFNFLYKYQHLEPKKYGHDFFPEKISYVVNPCEFCTPGALKCWKVPFRRWGGYTVARQPPCVHRPPPHAQKKSPFRGYKHVYRPALIAAPFLGWQGINMLTGV